MGRDAILASVVALAAAAIATAAVARVRSRTRRSTETACAAVAAACTDDLELRDASAGVDLALRRLPCRWDVHAAHRAGYHLVTPANRRIVASSWRQAAAVRHDELRRAPSSRRTPRP